MFRLLDVTLLFLLLTLASAVRGQPDNLQRSATVRVIDKDGAPLAGVQIVFTGRVKWMSYANFPCTDSDEPDNFCMVETKDVRGLTDENGLLKLILKFSDMTSDSFGDPRTARLDIEALLSADQQVLQLENAVTEEDTARSIQSLIMLSSPGASRQKTWRLSTPQRQAFLHYYSPVLLVRAEESAPDTLLRNSRAGWDWISNWKFDDDVFKNNAIWKRDLFSYIYRVPNQDGKIPNWRIRPTLYTALIEFMEADPDGRLHKCLKLLYHIYHPIDKRGKLHDWERIEMRIDSVGAEPGQQETISYVIITTHNIHNAMRGDDVRLKFFRTRDGKHPLLWQAQWDEPHAGDSDSLNGHELQFVTTDLTADMGKAVVDIEGPFNTLRGKPIRYSQKTFHYIFVDESSSATCKSLNAKAITPASSRRLAYGGSKNTALPAENTRRITYELQDIADIIPSMLEDSDWKALKIKKLRVLYMVDFQSALKDASGRSIIPPGPDKRFYPLARRDPSYNGRGRTGYVAKNWFWGSIRLGTARNGAPPFRQHDMFMFRSLSALKDEWPAEDDPKSLSSYRLPVGWQKKENGGFDGRWIQIFPDH